jgi:hypothetical protein
MTAYLEFLFAMPSRNACCTSRPPWPILPGSRWDRSPIAWIANNREIAKENLQRASNDQLSPSAIDALVRSTFINLGRTVVETCAFHSA